MQGQVGDRLLVRGAKVGQTVRTGEIVEVVDGDGRGRYRVRWSDGHQSTFSPGSDTTIDSTTREDTEWAEIVAARHARCAAWRRGITAGVGREASLSQQRLP